MQKYNAVVFRVLVFVCLLFLIVQPGVWAYLDAGYQRTMSYNIDIFIEQISSITGYGYSGNRTQIVGGRYMQNIIEILFKTTMGLKWGTIVLFLSYFMINYFTTKNILTKFTNKNFAYIGALIYTFNPLSIYMMNQIGFLYVYSAVPLIIFGFLQYFSNSKYSIIGLFVLCLGVIFSTSYARFTLIYILFFILLAIFYHKDVRLLILQKTRKCIIAFFSILCTSLPFVFSFIYPHFSHETEYFIGMKNYVVTFKSLGLGGSLYKGIKEMPISKLISPQEPTANILGTLSASNVFIYFSLIYFCFIVYFLVAQQHLLSKKEKKMLSIGVSAIAIGVIFRLLPHYVSQDTFVHISYEIFPFLASNSGFSYWFFLAGISIIIPISVYKASPKVGKIIVYGALIYCFRTTFMLVFFYKNPKLGTINMTEENPVYHVFHGTNAIAPIQKPQSAIIYPSNYLLFNRTPYPIYLEHLPGLLPGVEGNQRTTTFKQINFGKYISEPGSLGNNISNLGLLTISSFLVIQDIRDKAEHEQFDRYEDGKYVQLAQQSDAFLSQHNKVRLVEKNSLYKRYDINDLSRFSFLIYLPESVVFLSGYENIFDTGFVFSERPFLVDANSYNRPGYIDDGYIVPHSKNQTITIKTEMKNPSVYYVKLGGVTQGQDIIIQFNKTFDVNWKIKNINKSIYDGIPCSENIYYSISNNTFCYTNEYGNFREFWDVLLSREYPNTDHFEGNIIGNTWVLKDVNNESEGEMYIVISHDKQYLFIITQLIVAISFIIFIIKISIILKRNLTHE